MGLTTPIKQSTTSAADSLPAGTTDALVGSSGTPSSSNKFVTDADSRNTDTRTPTDGTVTAAKMASGAAASNLGFTSTTDNTIPRIDGTTGQQQTSGVSIDDSNGISGHTAVLNAQTGTTYTIAATDAGKHVLLTNASAITVTVPASLLAGFQCTWEQGGAGQISFSGSAVTAATLNNRQSQTKAAGQHAIGGLSCKTGTGSNAVVTLFGDTGT